MKKLLFQLNLLIVLAFTLTVASAAQNVVPNPIIALNELDVNASGSDGKPAIGIHVQVINWADYDIALFRALHGLPACGANEASRARLTFFDAATNQPFAELCAVKETGELKKLKFNVARSALPKVIYVILEDRRTSKKYTSNCLELATGKTKECQSAANRPVFVKTDLKIGKVTEITAKLMSVEIINTGSTSYPVNALGLRLTAYKPDNSVAWWQSTAISYVIAANQTIKIQVAAVSTNNLTGLRFRLKIDDGNLVAESDETNNETELIKGPGV